MTVQEQIDAGVAKWAYHYDMLDMYPEMFTYPSGFWTADRPVYQQAEWLALCIPTSDTHFAQSINWLSRLGQGGNS